MFIAGRAPMGRNLYFLFIRDYLLVAELALGDCLAERLAFSGVDFHIPIFAGTGVLHLDPVDARERINRC